MQLTSQDSFSEFKIDETLGLVIGSKVVVPSTVKKDEQEMTKQLADGRHESLVRMARVANKEGANGVVSINVSCNPLNDGAYELVAVGTAVKYKEPAKKASSKKK